MGHTEIDPTVKKPRYKITYFGYGQTPMYLYYDDKEEAVRIFESMAADPLAGVSTLELQQTIMQLKYVF